MTVGHNGGPPIREGNWIAVSREMIEHHIVGAGNMVTPADKNRGSFSRLESWLDLLSMANFAERKITVAGATLVLKPGQTLAGRAFLAKRWNWTEKAVRVWLEKLSTELMITLACEKLKEGQTKGHGPNVLSVCNWGRYQIEPMAEGPDLGRPQGHPRATQGPHYNKVTTKQDLDIDQTPPALPDQPKAGEEALPHGVFVNCQTVRHKSFSISIEAVAMQLATASGLGLTVEEARAHAKQSAVAHALQWALEIENGKLSGDVVPKQIANFIRGSVASQLTKATYGPRTTSANANPKRIQNTPSLISKAFRDLEKDGKL
jgi:hypothetical protein